VPPQQGGYASTPCRGKPVKNKNGKVTAYDPTDGGQLIGPVHTGKYASTSLCVQMMIDEHEQYHLDDTALQGACDQLMRTWAAKKAKATAKTREDYQKAKDDYDEARRTSECNAYERDAECLKKLRECCIRRGTKTTKRANKAIYCCLCKDVEEAEKEVSAGLRANKCKPAAAG
jgi:hypothetical protein